MTCSDCGFPRVKRGSTRCGPCVDRHRGSKAFRKTTGICQRCGAKALRGSLRCARHALEAKRETRRAACARYNARHRDLQRERRRRRTLRDATIRFFLALPRYCARCGQPIVRQFGRAGRPRNTCPPGSCRERPL